MLLVELFSSNLSELANQPYPTNKIKNNWYEFDTDAGLTYHIWFNKKKIQDKIVVDLEFSLESAIGIARVEGTGDAFRVFATVADTLKDYMSNNKNFDMLTFSSYKDEPSRVKLYNKIASLLSKQFPELEFLKTRESSDEIKYFFIRKSVNEETLDEGPIWDKVKKTAAAGAVAGAAGYGALTGQFTDKAKEPARAPVEITIPGGDLEQPKPEVKKEKAKLEPSTATNADPKMEKLVFLTALRSGIKGKELAQFMGQVAHETLGFQRLVEVGNKEYFNRYDPKYSPQKAKILGNVKVGDGLRYKGRGFIQITGRDNYKRAGQALGIDLENNPKLASNPEVAAKIAVWYWKSRVKPTVDDYTDTIGVTSKINPSMNGLGDRDMNFRHYLQRLQLED